MVKPTCERFSPSFVICPSNIRANFMIYHQYTHYSNNACLPYGWDLVVVKLGVCLDDLTIYAGWNIYDMADVG